MSWRVLIIGHTGGIGKALVAECRQAGWWVMGASRQPALKSEDVDTALAIDITLPKDRERLIDAIVECRINVVIFAAGTPHFAETSSVCDEDLTSVLACNLLAPMAFTSGLLRVRSDSLSLATVLYIGSAVGDIGLPGYSVYGASKSGLHRYVESLRRETAGQGVAFKLLVPRATKTTFNSAAATAYGTATGAGSDTPQSVAKAALRLIHSNQSTLSLGQAESLFAKLNLLFGARLDGAFKKHSIALRGLKSPL